MLLYVLLNSWFWKWIIPQCMLCVAVLTKINARIHWDEKQTDEMEHTLYNCFLCWATGQNASGRNRCCFILLNSLTIWNSLTLITQQINISKQIQESLSLRYSKNNIYSFNFVVEMHNHSWLYTEGHIRNSQFSYEFAPDWKMATAGGKLVSVNKKALKL